MPRRVGSGLLHLVALVLGCSVTAGCLSTLEGEDNGPPPDPAAADITSARLRTADAADAAVERAAAALGGTIVGRASSDECYSGQNNYKVHDGYDHRCTLRRAVAVAFDGDFRARLALLDQSLFAAGWGCYSDPCSETLAGKVNEYWDFRKEEYGGADPPITSLPTTSMYMRGDQHFDVAYVGPDRTGRGSLERFHHRRLGGLFTSYTYAHAFDVDAVFERASGYRYIVALAVEADYFEDTVFG